MDHTDEIMAHLITNQNTRIANLIETTGLSLNHLHTALRELRDAGKIRIEPDPHSHRWTPEDKATAIIIGGEAMNTVIKN